jgi:hypothetical protein
MRQRMKGKKDFEKEKKKRIGKERKRGPTKICMESIT